MNKQTTNMLARIAVVGLLSVGMTGVALADSVSLDTTGPGSNNTVTIDNTSTTSVTNDNTVVVTNVNEQDSSTGNVDVSGNTTVSGPIASGDATNNNQTVTNIGVGNGTGVVSVPPTGGGGGTTGGTTGPTGGQGGTTGSVLGASTGGTGSGSGAVLPEVGASVPVDVSALRALYHPTSAVTPTAALVSHSRTISAAFLGLAAMLSLLGALATAVYNERRGRRTT